MTDQNTQLRTKELRAQEAKPLQVVPNGFRDKQPLCDMPNRLKGLRACVVFDDKDHKKMSELLRELIGPDDKIRIGAWWSFIDMLPHIDENILLIFSPRKLNGNFPDLKEALARFRENRPDARVVLINLHNPKTEAAKKLNSLKADNLVDEIEHGFAYFPDVLQRSAEKQQKRVEMVG
jgi:hypothetical protein